MSRQYTDLDLNFIIHPITKDISKNVDKQAVIRAIQNLVRTNHYEIPFNPSIGGNMQKMLFEPLSPVVANSIRREIEEVIKNYEPRATIRSISVIENSQEDGYEVTMEFYINNLTEPVAISTFLERA
jgi:phage baseplate assembly protein W